MVRPEDNQQPGCSGKCSYCRMDDARQGHTEGAYHGWRLTVVSLIMFINPIAMAVIGAILLPMFWASEHAMFTGAAGGLVFGIMDSAIIGAIIRKSGKKEDEFDTN